MLVFNSLDSTCAQCCMLNNKLCNCILPEHQVKNLFKACQSTLSWQCLADSSKAHYNIWGMWFLFPFPSFTWAVSIGSKSFLCASAVDGLNFTSQSTMWTGSDESCCHCFLQSLSKVFIPSDHCGVPGSMLVRASSSRMSFKLIVQYCPPSQTFSFTTRD